MMRNRIERLLSITRSDSGGLRLRSPIKRSARFTPKATLRKGWNGDEEIKIEYKRMDC
jgi:hypothetical protein